MRLFIKAVRRVLTTTLCVVVFASSITSSSVFAAKAQPASDSLSRQKVSEAADHEIVFKTPSGVDAPTDTITLALPDFTFGALGIGDIDLFHGPVTGFEGTDVLAAVPAAGVWGVSIAGTNITFTAPTNAVPGTVPLNDMIGIRIGTNAVGGVNRLVNPAVPVAALITIGGTFGDENSLAVAIVGNDTVSVTATVAATTTPPSGGGGGSGDTAPPVISNVQAVNITSSTVTIIWTTNENSSSLVEYGFTTSYASGTVSDSNDVLSHVLNLSGLSPGTTYHFDVSSQDPSGNIAVSGDYTFTTLPPAGDTTPPVISNVKVVNITDTSALVTWDTNELATSFVSYGMTTAYGSLSSSLGYVLSHAILLNGLTPNTLYHFFVSSSDGSGNIASSPDATFTTIYDITPPANVYNLGATPGDTVVTLNWINPPDLDFAGTRIVRKEGGFPTNPFDGALVFIGVGNTALDTGLTNGVTYYYGAFAFDTHGNFASGALANAMPFGLPVTPTTTPPIPPVVPPPVLPPTTTPPIVPPPVVPPTTLLPPGVIPLPSPPPGQPGAISAQYYGAGGTVLLTPDISGNIGVLAGSQVVATVSINGVGQSINQATLSIGGSTYILQPNGAGTAYSGSFIAPPIGTYQAVVIVLFDNNTAVQSINTLVSQGGGQVVEMTLTGPSSQGVPDVVVQLYREIGGTWVAYGSPQNTRPDGSYAYTVPNGRYYAEITKEGYRKSITETKTVERNVFNEVIPIIKIPIPIEIQPQENLLQQISDIATNAAKEVSYGIKVARELMDSPAVQAINNVAGPSLLAISFINTANTLSAFNLLAYLQYLFTQPILLFGRRRRKKWGVVFNSLTKMPIDLAIVRLIHSETRQAVQTRVTDKFGRFAFFAKPGNYIIEVVKPGYVFPTQYLKDKNEDVQFVDLYHGARIELKIDTVLTPNIPLDPVTTVETPGMILWRKFTKSARHAVAFSGIPLGMVIVVVTPGLPTALLLLAQIGVYLLFKRIALPIKPKSWGISFDNSTRKPLANVIVRIFDKKFNKLLETQITDKNGKYGFFVKRNIYYIVAEKPSYEKFTSPDIDLSNLDEAMVNLNIPLIKAKK
ncbi:MAG: fibronectin type III domain-containing protein [Patescibacteria group bacterium]